MSVTMGVIDKIQDFCVAFMDDYIFSVMFVESELHRNYALENCGTLENSRNMTDPRNLLEPMI